MPESVISARPSRATDRGGASNREAGGSSRLHGEAAFRLLIEAVVDYAIFLLGPDGRVLTWNVGAERMKGYRRDEIVGRHFSAFYTPEDVADGRPQRVLAGAAADGRYEDEGWRVRKDGSRFWADVVVSCLRDERGEISGYAKVTRDLTERHAAAQRDRKLALEQRARTAAEAALRARDRFLRIASHELRTPIASLQVSAEALLRAGRRDQLDADRLDQTLRRVELATARIGALLDELLDVSRLEHDAPPLRLETVEVGEMVRGAAAGIEEDGAAGRIAIDVEPGLRVRGDQSRLDQVVTNLIDNALKYSSEQVRIGAAHLDGGVLLAVSDGGIGVDGDGGHALFDPFVRGAGVAHIPGIGLGLYIARQIVERHGGWIGLESAGRDRGTTVSVWLPGHTS